MAHQEHEDNPRWSVHRDYGVYPANTHIELVVPDPWCKLGEKRGLDRDTAFAFCLWYMTHYIGGDGGNPDVEYQGADGFDIRGYWDGKDMEPFGSFLLFKAIADVMDGKKKCVAIVSFGLSCLFTAFCVWVYASIISTTLPRL